MQAGVPEAAEPVPVTLVAAADALVAAAALAATLGLEPLDGATAIGVDDAAHPAVTAPAASSGMASRTFFTRSPNASILVSADLYDAAVAFPVGPRFAPARIAA